MNNKEKVDILKKYFLDRYGNINLSNIDLGSYNADLKGIRTEGHINNSEQKAYYIFNSRQKATYIYNDEQEAKKTFNSHQNVEEDIYNEKQIAKKTIY